MLPTSLFGTEQIAYALASVYAEAVIQARVSSEFAETSHELRSVAYFSKATRALDLTDLHELFERASRFNALVDVTGILLFADGVFIQTVEGLCEDVQKVFERILDDPLHAITTVIMDERIERRLYPGWVMRASFIPPDATLVSFLEYRMELLDSKITVGQLHAVSETLAFAKLQIGADSGVGVH